jgi:hypothetical protein
MGGDVFQTASGASKRPEAQGERSSVQEAQPPVTSFSKSDFVKNVSGASMTAQSGPKGERPDKRVMARTRKMVRVREKTFEILF